MTEPSIPSNEKERLFALHEFDVLDTPPEQEYEIPDKELALRKWLNYLIGIGEVVRWERREKKDRDWHYSFARICCKRTVVI